MIDAIVCPYCRFKDPAPKDCDEGVNPYQCRDCGQTFDVVKETTVTYRAIPTLNTLKSNHDAIINTPIGGECRLFIDGAYKTYRVEKETTDPAEWCGGQCPFSGCQITSCPQENTSDTYCAMSSKKHKSGVEVIIVEVKE